jgi:hypothetical protein
MPASSPAFDRAGLPASDYRNAGAPNSPAASFIGRDLTASSASVMRATFLTNP